MRLIGSIADATDANRFGDYLTSAQIANTIEQGASGWSVRVHDDDKLDRARAELQAFQSNPADSRYDESSKVAKRVRDAQIQREERLRKNFIDYRTRWAKLSGQPMPLTIILVAICAIVAAATKLGTDLHPVGDWLMFETLSDAQARDQTTQEVSRRIRQAFGKAPKTTTSWRLKQPGLDQILHGQVWRIFTPMFIHFGFIHILFNMLWLVDLGGTIERMRGTLFFAGLVLATAAVSSFVQFYWDGPSFGGMSGVVYGLFGYVWIKSLVDPSSGFVLSSNTIITMIVWLFLCMSGFIGNVANGGHVGGLIAGMVLAHAPHSWRKMKRAVQAARE